MTNAETVKLGIVGAGWWATTAHIPALQGHPNADIVAVQKRNRQEACKVASDFGIANACVTMEEVLAVPGLEAVVIASTPNMHYDQAKAALERGLHVLLEKPMTFTAAQAEELVRLAAGKNVQLAISCPWHYTPHNIEARRLIAEGALGEIKMIGILMTNFTKGLYEGLPWDKVFGDSPTLQNAAAPYLAPAQNSYSDPLVAGGGQIYCQVSHVAAHLGFLTGSEPTQVFARFDNAGTNVDVYDTLNLKLENGAIVSLASTGATMLSDRQYEVRVYGTRGMIFLELWKGAMELHDIGCNVKRYPALAEADVYPMYEPARNFVDTIIGKAPNGSPGWLGSYAMKIIEAACRSASSGANVHIG